MAGAYLGGRAGEFINDIILMLLFAPMMVATSLGMLRKKKTQHHEGGHHTSWTKAMLIGFVVGAATGLVGAGGGFLIVPALVLLAGTPMAVAVGTLLLVIVLKNAT